MKRYLLCLLALAALVMTGCKLTGNHVDDDEHEVSVPLDQVPAAALAAAKKAVPGIEFEEAESEVEDGVTVYELEGTANGKEYEVEVTADGKVLEVEEDDEGEDDDGDDDEKDDD